MSVWARDGRGRDERRVGGTPGPRNYRPLPASQAGAGTVHLAAARLGARKWDLPGRDSSPPAWPRSRGPEPERGKRGLDVCARCQVWCACVPVGRDS